MFWNIFFEPFLYSFFENVNLISKFSQHSSIKFSVYCFICIYYHRHIRKKEMCGSLPLSSVQFSSVAQSCPTFCNPINRSTPGLPVRHQLPEFTETHVHRVSDAIQPSHPLSSPSPSAPNPSQHQSLFQ